MTVELSLASLRKFAAGRRDEYESLLGELVEMPTVSAQPDHKGDILRCADFAAATISRFGGKATVIKTTGNPVVHGSFVNERGLPRVTVYNHLDVQPASRETESWETEPFVFTKKGDTYFGRGTTDDKGPAVSALFGILAAREAGVPINTSVLWEFEEEIGSGNFASALKSKPSVVTTDSIVVSDTIWVSRKRPACPAGLRGLYGFTLVLETGTTDVHSGTTGGAARNPLGELMKLVSEMYDATTGRVKIKGFYDDVEPPTKREIADFRNSGFTVREFKKAHKLKSIRSDDALDVMKRLWAMPTMEVHGVVGGYTGPGVKTVIPPRAEVKVSCRLVCSQDPVKIEKLIKAFVKGRNGDVKVEPESHMYPYKAPTEGPYADAIRRSMKFAFGREPVFVREGGSIGAVPSMEKLLDCPVLFLGLSLPEHGYHAPNENFDWRQASGGMIAFARYFQELSQLSRTVLR
ncbi:MAG TPA: M20/M25/M40 family metallo-hydrolase [Thermoanaerobaculia bacterium]|nr:M20/M25/M40 family metallo-hydrolase [Thermoanaerobaculia bacterium]